MAFSTEPIVGWRAWRIIDYRRRGTDDEPRLASLTGRETWQPRRRTEATCLPEKSRRFGFGYGVGPQVVHEPPWPSCNCGIWAVRDRDAVEDLLARERDLGVVCFGPVSLWGRVLEFERGYRAQYAYPKVLFFYGGDGRLARQVQELYGVSTWTVQDPRLARLEPPPTFSVAPNEVYESLANLGRPW